MTTIYAIGDVHGYLNKLSEALRWIEADGGETDQVILLGDLVDRGPDSRGVIDLIQTGIAEGRNWTALMGNHDRMFRNFVMAGEIHDARIYSGKSWLHPALGGCETLASYGIEASDNGPIAQIHKAAQNAIPEAHISFLNSLPLYHQEPGLIFVHAGLRPGIPLAYQEEDDLIWIREPFLNETQPFEALVVHGHSPVDKPTFYGNRVNLDTGAGYGRDLSVGVFEQNRVFSLTEHGREQL